MSTKISGVDGSQIASVGAGRAVQRPQDAVSEGTTPATPHDVQITGTARQLVDLDQKVRDLPAVNEARVGQIRQSIEQGTYTVRPQHAADQLLSLERALRNLPDSGESEGSNESGNPG